MANEVLVPDTVDKQRRLAVINEVTKLCLALSLDDSKDTRANDGKAQGLIEYPISDTLTLEAAAAALGYYRLGMDKRLVDIIIAVTDPSNTQQDEQRLEDAAYLLENRINYTTDLQAEIMAALSPVPDDPSSLNFPN